MNRNIIKEIKDVIEEFSTSNRIFYSKAKPHKEFKKLRMYKGCDIYISSRYRFVSLFPISVFDHFRLLFGRTSNILKRYSLYNENHNLSVSIMIVRGKYINGVKYLKASTIGIEMLNIKVINDKIDELNSL